MEKARKSSFEIKNRKRLGDKTNNENLGYRQYQSDANVSTNLSVDDQYSPINQRPGRDLESYNYTSEMIFLSLQDTL